MNNTSVQLRDHFDRHVMLLRTANSMHARQVALNLAQSIGDSALGRQAKNLPTVGPASRFGPMPSPISRDEAFDAAIESFIQASYAVLDALAAQEKRVAANDTRSSADCRELVLKYLYASGRDNQSALAIQNALDLSNEQVIYALEQLQYERALAGDTSHGAELWHVRLSAHGRNLAEGTATGTVPSVVVNQQFQESPSAVVGVNFGHVTQSVTVFPALPDDVREALAHSQAGKELVEALDEARKAPNPTILRSLATTVKTLIESANVTTEVAAHGHEWLQTVMHWLAAVRL